MDIKVRVRDAIVITVFFLRAAVTFDLQPVNLQMA